MENTAQKKEKLAVHWITQYEPATAILHSKACREVTFKGLVPLLGHTIVTVEGAVHHQRRALEGQLFALPVLQAYESGLIPQLIEQTLVPSLAQGRADLVALSHAIAARIAAQVIGLDGLDEPDRLQAAIHYLSALVGGTSSASATGEILTRREARNHLRTQFINGAIDRRRNFVNEFRAGKRQREQLPFDLITLLLLHSNDAEQTWDAKQVAAEVSFYAVAAIDTTATLLPHLLHELWHYFAVYPEQSALAHDLTFLRNAASEALRLHPVVPTIFRQAIQPLTIAGYQFEVGQTAGIFVPEANRDKKIFGLDASDFKPLRQIPPKIRRSGLSFGGGSHLCLGRELALGSPQVECTSTESEPSLYGEVALIAQALLQKQVRPDPTQVIIEPSSYERNVFKYYPILYS
jgi:cytochrome P450